MVDILPPAGIKPPSPRRRSSEAFRPRHEKRTRNRDAKDHTPESAGLVPSATHMATALEHRRTRGNRANEILEGFADGKLDREAALAEWKDKHRLQALNLKEDTRYTFVRDSLITQWLTFNPKPNDVSALEAWELSYEKQVKEAADAALRKFTRENFPDYRRYEKYGLYLDDQGDVSPALDPLVQNTDRNIHEASYREFPHDRATHLKKWRVVNTKVAKRYWESFVVRFPEKARLYAPNHRDINAALLQSQTK